VPDRTGRVLALTTRQLAEMTQTHPNWVRKEIQEGRLEAWRVGQQYRISVAAAAAWIADKQVEREGQAPDGTERLIRVEQDARRGRR
jgi:excisionase family DNA binding protein